MTTRHGLTLEQFLALEDTKPASEYVRGEVCQKPMPNTNHMRLQRELVTELTLYLRTRRIGEAGPEWRCIFGPENAPRAYVPDVAYASYRRFRGEPDLRMAPDLAVEILSPDQSMRQMTEKIEFYLANGVQLVWVIDPATRTVRVLRPGKPERLLRESDALLGEDVLPGFHLALAALFAVLDSVPAPEANGTA